MLRRNFIKRGLLLTAGCSVTSGWLTPAAYASNSGKAPFLPADKTPADLFKNPSSHHRPFVRWWWNGDKVEAEELIRELHLLKEAGIGGVEINPISFPSCGDDRSEERRVGKEC